MDAKTLIDKYLPEYTYNEYHAIIINCPITKCYEVAKDFDLSKSKLIKTLFKMRGVPTSNMNLQGLILNMGFTNLEEQFPTENLIGFWAKKKIEQVTCHKDFVENSISARIKVAWNFRFEKLNSNQTHVSTETRVLCVSLITKVFFSIYWLFIKPFSGAIRKKMLLIVKREAELIETKG